jgi:hypothetical protein
MTTHTVITCKKRIDGQYLVTYRIGATTYSALSPVEIEEGKSVLVSGGKAFQP